MADLGEFHDQLLEMDEQVRPIFETFSDNLYSVLSIKSTDRETRTWELVMYRPAPQDCVLGDCVWGLAQMIERKGAFNVIEYDVSAERKIRITFRAEAPTNMIVLVNKTKF